MIGELLDLINLLSEDPYDSDDCYCRFCGNRLGWESQGAIRDSHESHEKDCPYVKAREILKAHRPKPE